MTNVCKITLTDCYKMRTDTGNAEKSYTWIECFSAATCF